MYNLGLSYGGDFAVEVAPLEFGDQHKSEQVELFIVTLILAQSIYSNIDLGSIYL